MLKTLLLLQLRSALAGMTAKKGKNGYKKASKGRTIALICLFAFIAIVCSFAFVGLFMLLGMGLTGSEHEWLFFAVMAILIFLVDFITTIFMAKSLLFEAKDNDLLLSLPIKPRDILVSRMLFLLLSDYLFEILIALPAIGIWCYMGNATVVGCVLFLVCMVFMPLLAISLASLVGWLLSILVKRMKHKTLYTTLFSIAFIGLYMAFVPFIQMYMELIITHAEEVAGVVKTYLPMFYFFGNGVVEGNVLHALLFCVMMFLPFALVCYILSRSFISIVTNQKGGNKTRAKREQGRATPIGQSLLKKEFRQLLSSSGYMLNAGLGLLFLLVIGVGVFFMDVNGLFVLFPQLPSTAIPGICMVAICICNGLIFFTAPSVSLEGQNIYLLQSLPLRGKDVFMAKVNMHLVIVCPVTLLVSICTLIAFPTTLLMSVLVILVPQIFTVFIALFGLVMNLAFPKFDYENEVIVVKQSISTLLAMLMGMFGTMILAGAGVALSILLSSVEGAVALCALVPLGASVGMYLYLNKKGDAIFAKLG